MVALLAPAESQFCDANGAPLSGGTLETFVPNTTTQKITWSDPAGTVANSNPIILDSAGRAIIFGDGVYRTVLKDQNGNLIWDQVSSTVVSTFMSPICLAPDLATAQSLLQIVPNAATTLATLTAGLAAANAAIAAEAARALAAEAVLNVNLAAAYVDLGWMNDLLVALTTKNTKSGGTGPTDSTGHYRVVFPTAFTTISSFVAQAVQTRLEPVVIVAEYDVTGADCWALNSTNGVPVVTNFAWIATGS